MTEASVKDKASAKEQKPKAEKAPKERKVGKAEQRIQELVKFLKTSKEPKTYADMQEACGFPFPDAPMHACLALEAAGLVKRAESVSDGGRGRVRFVWVK